MAGSICLFIGPMFSGKSSCIINELEKYNIAGMKTLMIKYSKDDRYTTQNQIITHNKRVYSEKEGSVQSTNDLSTLDEYVQNNEIRIIGIDEFQFYENPDNVIKWANSGIHVYLAALDGDYQSNIFENISFVIPYCSRIKKLHSVCKYCKNLNAIMTRRTIYNPERVFIGGPESYIAVCRNCAK